MSTGRDITFAFGKGSTWHTAVAVNAVEKGLLIQSGNALHYQPEMILDESAGVTLPEYIELGNVNIAPTISAFARWDSHIWALVGMVMGNYTAGGGGGPSYTHTMNLNSTSSYFATLCLDDGVTVREIPSAKITGFTMRGSSGGFIEIEFNVIGDNVLYTGQTNTTLGSVTYNTKTQLIPFGVGKIMINDQSSGALTDGTDNVCPIGWELSVQRQMEQDFTACSNAEATPGLTSEPQDNGHIETTLSLELPEYTTNDWLAKLKAGTEKKCTLYYYVAGSGQAYELYIKIPRLKILNAAADVSGAGRIPTTIEMRGLKAQSAPTGMTITDLQVALINQDNATYL